MDLPSTCVLNTNFASIYKYFIRDQQRHCSAFSELSKWGYRMTHYQKDIRAVMVNSNAISNESKVAEVGVHRTS